MTILDFILAHASRAVGAVAILVTTFWKGDDLISSDGRKLIAARINGVIAAPGEAAAIEEMVRAYFSGRLPAVRFAANVMLFTISSMLLLLVIYIALTPNFLTSLINDPMQRSALFSQFFIDGLTKTFVANYVGFSIYSYRSERVDFDPAKSLFIDVVIKVVVFIALTAAIYVAYANVTGAFAGKTATALAAVGPTILLAAKFKNLTAVYLYSLAISSLPLYLAALARALSDYPRFAAVIGSLFFWLPFQDKPVRALATVLGCLFAVFAVTAGIFAAAISR
jgi:hypothetical protein